MTAILNICQEVDPTVEIVPWTQSIVTCCVYKLQPLNPKSGNHESHHRKLQLGLQEVQVNRDIVLLLFFKIALKGRTLESFVPLALFVFQ